MLVLGFGRSFTTAVAELADVKPGEAVIDLGCGTGTLLEALLARQPNARFTGIDPDPQVLAMARRRLQRTAVAAELIQGYAQQLPFPNAAFDLVVSTLTFHHLPDPAKVAALREVRRVLAPRGRSCWSTSAHRPLKSVECCSALAACSTAGRTCGPTSLVSCRRWWPPPTSTWTRSAGRTEACAISSLARRLRQ